MEVFAGLQEDIAELEELVHKKMHDIQMKINYHLKKQKIEEYRRMIKELGKK